MTQARKIVNKGWGWEDWIVNKPEYCGKVLFVKQNKKCSVHYHKLKDETFYLQSGQIWVKHIDLNILNDLVLQGLSAEEIMDDTKHNNIIWLNPGNSLHIPPNTVHQFYGYVDSTIIEFSTQHFDEDSYRIIKGD